MFELTMNVEYLILTNVLINQGQHQSLENKYPWIRKPPEDPGLAPRLPKRLLTNCKKMRSWLQVNIDTTLFVKNSTTALGQGTSINRHND